MALGPTTSAVVDPVLNEWYTGVSLMRALPQLNHARFAQRPINFPQKSGKRALFRRYESLPVAKAPLVEMTTPSPVQMTKTDLYADLVQYGSYVKYSDIVDYTTQDPFITERMAVVGEQAGESLDEAQRDQLLATTSEYLAGAVAARGDIVTKALGSDFDKIARVLHNARAKFIDDETIKASTGVGTGPIRPCFYVLVHPDVAYDIDNTTNFPGFKYPSEYADGGKSALPSEIGAYKNFRFLMSDKESILIDSGGAVGVTGLKSTGASYVDVYQCLIFARDAYGVVQLSGKSYQTYVTRVDVADKADPLGQYGTIGWKAMTTLVLLNETFMLRYECGATA